MTWNLREFRREPATVGSLLQWDALDDRYPWLLWQRNGTLMAVLSFRGQDLDSAEDAALVAQAAHLNHIFRRFGGGWGLMSEARHQAVTAYPESPWPDPVSAAVDRERQAYFTQPNQHFETVTWLTLVWRMPSQETTSMFQRLFYEDLPVTTTGTQWAVESFVEECLRTRDLLQGCLQDVTFLEGSAALTYLHQCISTQQHWVRVPDPACYLNTYLTDVDVHVGLNEVILGPAEQPEAVIACLSPSPQQGHPAYPNQTYPGILTVLNALPFAWRCCVRYLPFSRDRAIKEVSRYVKQHASEMKKGFTSKQKNASAIVEQAAVERSQEASAAQAAVEHGHHSEGALTLTVVVWDAEREALARKVRQAEASLHTEGFLVKRETYNTAEAWLGTMPGNTLANVRKPLLSSANFAHLFPSMAPWRGQARNSHLQGPALTYGVNRHGTPVAVCLHHHDTAHSAIMGTTGDGKSTLLNFFCTQARRYRGHEVAIWDKGGAAQVLTYLMGGAWYDLARTPLQPLAHVDDPHEQTWAVDWLSGLLAVEHVRVTPRIKTLLYTALQELGTWNPVKRTMTHLAGLVDHRSALEGVALYTHNGPYGASVDGDHETISTQPWLCFEMASILESLNLLTSVLPALFHLRERRMMGAPTCFAMHEAWVALNNPYWESRLQAWLKGFRVRNGYLIALNQSLGEAVTAKIMPALLDNMQNWIFTPNDKAEEEEIGKYYRAIGLNTRQRELIRGGHVKQDYYVVTKTGQAMLDFKLGPVAVAACRTWGPDDLQRFAAMYADDPDNFATTYFAEQGVRL